MHVFGCRIIPRLRMKHREFERTKHVSFSALYVPGYSHQVFLFHQNLVQKRQHSGNKGHTAPFLTHFFTANSGGFLPESTIICVFWTKFTLSMFTSSKCKAGRKAPGCRRGIKGKPQKTKFQVSTCFFVFFRNSW